MRLKRKLKWYALLLALLLPLTLAAAGVPPDGVYLVEAKLSGGSGRSGIVSPVELAVEGGTMTAAIVWSSPYYTWMEVDGQRYEPEPGQKNAVFVIRVPALDEDIPVTAETVAMSEPHEISYTLRLAAPEQPGAPWLWVGGTALGLVLLCGAALVLLRRKRGAA